MCNTYLGSLARRQDISSEIRTSNQCLERNPSRSRILSSTWALPSAFWASEMTNGGLLMVHPHIRLFLTIFSLSSKGVNGYHRRWNGSTFSQAYNAASSNTLPGRELRVLPHHRKTPRSRRHLAESLNNCCNRPLAASSIPTKCCPRRYPKPLVVPSHP